MLYVVKDQLRPVSVVLGLPDFLPGVVDGVVVVVYVGVVAVQLAQLDGDDPLLVPLGHQASILVFRLSAPERINFISGSFIVCVADMEWNK